MANGFPEERAGFVGMVGMVGFDETHGKWGVVSGLYRLDVGGLRKEIWWVSCDSLLLVELVEEGDDQI